MAHKILVATDLSRSSTAGIRFALQLASQQPTELIFYYVMDAQMPTTWSQSKYLRYVDEQLNATRKKLRVFVERICRQTGVGAENAEYVVEFEPFVDTAIINYAVRRKVDFICMSTRGAGVVKRIFGTNTSAVLSKSPIPVLAIPHDYRRSRISHVLYASDLTALASELKHVKRFADASKSRVSVIHYAYVMKPEARRRNLERASRRYRGSEVNFLQQEYNFEQSMAEQLKSAVDKYKPSVLAVFTKQDKTLLQRFFPQSNSERLSFTNKKPLLVFPKQGVSN